MLCLSVWFSPKWSPASYSSWLWTGPRSQMLKLSWEEEACRFQSLYPKEIWLSVGFRPWPGSWPPDACWRAKTAPGTRDRTPLVKGWSPLLLLKRALTFHQDPPFLPWLLSPLETGDPPPLFPPSMTCYSQAYSLHSFRDDKIRTCLMAGDWLSRCIFKTARQTLSQQICGKLLWLPHSSNTMG